MSRSQNGNVLFFILIAVALVGLLTMAIQSSSQTGSENIDDETLLIQASEIRQYATELENAVRFIMQNGHSENDLRFAHPEAHPDYGNITISSETQIFHRSGGAATYRLPRSRVNNGDRWEFYAGTHLPGAGTDRADLIAVLPNINEPLCQMINKQIGYTGQPLDTGACLHEGPAERFDSGNFSSTANTVDVSSFSSTPAFQGCVLCGSNYHFYHVLMAR